MTWNRSRTLSLGGLAAGAAALLVAVLSAFGGSETSAVQAASATISSHTVRIGQATVAIRVLPSGACYTVRDREGSAHACPATVAADELSFVLTQHGVGGIAGAGVAAVIVRLSHRGTVWATLRDGGFYAALPPGHRVRAVVKVLRDGSRTAFPA